MNILRSNDGLSAIKTSEIFDKNGELLISKEGEKLGELNLSIKSNGYVSFVRGENPYIFPFKVYPRDYESPSEIVFNFEYPKIQYNGVAINRGIQFLDLYLSQMSDFQRRLSIFYTKTSQIARNEKRSQK